MVGRLWGGLYERLIKEIKATLYKTLGKSRLLFNQLETVILDIERHLNNRPLTYVESSQEEEQILTPTQFSGDKIRMHWEN